jgi:hypothetical protein
MHRRMKIWLLTCVAGLALSLVIPPTPAQACIVDNSYRVPTNLELVERADTILLGVVESGPTDINHIGGAQLVVRPTLLLKGATLPAEIRTGGMIAPARFAVPSNPNELEQAHPLAYIGGCIRYIFPRGATVLWFFGRENGELVPLGYPFARSAEDVPSADAPWVRAVRLYVEVAALPEAERRDALVARRNALAARTDDPAAAIIVADIDRQLRGPNRTWNAIMEDEIRRMERDGRDPFGERRPRSRR